MDSRYVSGGILHWVSPFGYPRIKGYLLLPVAFRSLSRLSSALSAKASTLRSFLLDLYPIIIGSKDMFFGIALPTYLPKLFIKELFCCFMSLACFAGM